METQLSEEWRWGGRRWEVWGERVVVMKSPAEVEASKYFDHFELN